jgi:tRNA pseudouridine38-40 synthase
MKIALGLEYDGSGFNGWQSQQRARTVQACVEAALSKVADHPVKAICAGRTDTGVHATGQVAHFSTSATRSLRSWVLGANVNLPPDAAVTWARPVADDFHARFGAISRRYRYIILNREVRPAVSRAKVTWQRRALDEVRMQRAADYLLGEHDFTSFRALACQAKNPVRRVHELSVTRDADCVYIDVHADAFLYHMVRNIAGVLMTIGVGERPAAWTDELLRLRDRARGGVTAPADGLYLVHVAYDPRFGLPDEFMLPRYAG